MRLLHPRDAARRTGAAGARRRVKPGGDQGASVGELLPLYRVSGDRRCRGGGGEDAARAPRSAGIDPTTAKAAPGVIAVVAGAELAKVITPWVGVLTHLKGIKSAPQHAIAVDVARWQGEAVAAVVARTRAEAEDARALVIVDYAELPAVTDPETALDPQPPIGDGRRSEEHPSELHS